MPRITMDFFEGKRSVAHCDLTVKRVDWNIDFNSYLNHMVYLIGGRISSTNISIINETLDFHVVRPSDGNGVAASHITDEHEEPATETQTTELEDGLREAAAALGGQIPYAPKGKVET